MATGVQEFVDNTTADVFIPEIWSQDAIVARENRLVFAKLVNRKYEKELTVGDTVHVPSITNLTSRTKSANTAITFETQTETNTNITVSTDEYSAMAVESITKLQANRDLMASYAGKMGYALDLAVDDVLAGLVDDVTNAIGSLVAEISYVDLLRARQYLDDADVPEEDRWIVISPAQEAGFLKLDHFINRDYTENLNVGKGEKDTSRGYMGTWMSYPVYKSVNVEGSNSAGHDNVFAHKEAFALVMQMMPKSYSQFDIDYIVDKVAMEQVYGSQEMRDNHAVWMRGA